MKRRNFLSSSAAIGSLGLAGCIGPFSANDVFVGSFLDSESTSPLSRDVVPLMGEEEAEHTIISIDDPACDFCASFWNEEFEKLNNELISTGDANMMSVLMSNLSQWGDIAQQYLVTVYMEMGSEEYYELKHYYMQVQDQLNVSSVHTMSKDYINDELDEDGEDIEDLVEQGHYDDIIEDMDQATSLAGVRATPNYEIYRDSELVTNFEGLQSADTFVTFIE